MGKLGTDAVGLGKEGGDLTLEERGGESSRHDSKERREKLILFSAKTGVEIPRCKCNPSSDRCCCYACPVVK